MTKKENVIDACKKFYKINPYVSTFKIEVNNEEFNVEKIGSECIARSSEHIYLFKIEKNAEN